jgi:hypothetical protein
MFMPKTPLSVTLDDANLLWLKGRAAGRKRRSLSAALDDILTEARTGGHGRDTPTSVVGTIDLASHDPALDDADATLQTWFDESLRSPVVVRETRAPFGEASRKKSARPPRRG